MTQNYFAIERGDKSFTDMCIADDFGNVIFEDLMNMSYDELTEYDAIEEFVATAMKVSNELFNSEDEQTIITLVGTDDIFIWSVIIGPEENDLLRYVLVDWQKDGKTYRYAQD